MPQQHALRGVKAAGIIAQQRSMPLRPHVAVAAGMWDSLPILTAAAGELSDAKVAGYFIFLGTLVAVPFVGGIADQVRIQSLRSKREVSEHRKEL